MIDCDLLKRLVLQIYSANPFAPVKEVVADIDRLSAYQDAFPSPKKCRRYDIYH